MKTKSGYNVVVKKHKLYGWTSTHTHTISDDQKVSNNKEIYCLITL